MIDIEKTLENLQEKYSRIRDSSFKRGEKPVDRFDFYAVGYVLLFLFIPLAAMGGERISMASLYMGTLILGGIVFYESLAMMNNLLKEKERLATKLITLIPAGMLITAIASIKADETIYEVTGLLPEYFINSKIFITAMYVPLISAYAFMILFTIYYMWAMLEFMVRWVLSQCVSFLYKTFSKDPKVIVDRHEKGLGRVMLRILPVIMFIAWNMVFTSKIEQEKPVFNDFSRYVILKSDYLYGSPCDDLSPSRLFKKLEGSKVSVYSGYSAGFNIVDCKI